MSKLHREVKLKNGNIIMLDGGGEWREWEKRERELGSIRYKAQAPSVSLTQFSRGGMSAWVQWIFHHTLHNVSHNTDPPTTTPPDPILNYPQLPTSSPLAPLISAFLFIPLIYEQGRDKILNNKRKKCTENQYLVLLLLFYLFFPPSNLLAETCWKYLQVSWYDQRGQTHKFIL